jgi:hypothetical protein
MPIRMRKLTCHLVKYKFVPKNQPSNYRSARRLRMKTKTRVTISKIRAEKLDIALCNFLIDMMLPLWVRALVKR